MTTGAGEFRKKPNQQKTEQEAQQEKEDLQKQLDFIKSLQEDPSKHKGDPAAYKQDMHTRLGALVNNLVQKIQGKHESLIEK